MSKFQVITILIILVIVFVAVLVLSGVVPGLPGGSSRHVANLKMWGTFHPSKLNEAIVSFNAENQKKFSINYSQKQEDAYENSVVDALAEGKGPDIWIITQDLVLKHQDKISKISFETFKERDFRDTFIDAGDLFLGEDGIIAVPFLVDPIVLYWNKDLFNKAGLAIPPRYWEDFLSYVGFLTKKNDAGFVLQSGTALGEFSNIQHAKEIFSMLVLQSGNKIIQPNEDTGELGLVFGERGGLLVDPVASALNFYINFSNPAKLSYSWNRSFSSAREMFVSGKLAMYFGYGSEYEDLKEANPHLNFDAVMVPQMKESPIEATFGRVYALAIPKSSTYINPSVEAVFAFLDKEIISELETNLRMASTRRDMLAKQPKDSFFSLIYKSALLSRAWLEPDSAVVSDIFKDMMESVITGRKRISEAVRDARVLLKEELDKVK